MNDPQASVQHAPPTSAGTSSDLPVRFTTLEFRIGQFEISVLVDERGVFQGIQRVSVIQAPGDNFGPRPAAFPNIEDYYDTAEPE
jgi:hypothetical protein